MNKNFKKFKINCWLVKLVYVTIFQIFLISFVHANTQLVFFEPGEKVLMQGEKAEFDLIYDVDMGKGKSTGLGIRIHYNSNTISNLSLIETYGEGLAGQDYLPKDDIEDFDNDPNTDKYICVAWVGITGQWPSIVSLPLRLGKIIAQLKTDINMEETQIKISYSSIPIGYSFESKSISLFIK